MLSSEPTLREKMMFVPKPTQQCCRAHLSPAIFFCSKPTCQLYTFLCQRCRRDNLHGHQDDIHDYAGWIQRMSERASRLKVTSQQRIFESVRGEAGKSLRRYVGELKRIMEVIEALELQLFDLIRQSKAKISAYIRKYEGFGESRLASRGHLYSNPYLLAAKISSERNDNFIQELKQCLRGQAELVDGFNPKYEVITLQSKLKQVIQGNNSDLFTNNKEINKIPKIQLQQQKVLLCQSKPQKLFMRGETLLIGLRNQTQIYNLASGQVQDRYAIGFSKCSAVGQDLIGINRDNNKILITYINKQIGSFTFDFRICSILLYIHKSKPYAMLGMQEGKILIFDIKRTSIIATLSDGHNSKVEFLQPWEGEMKVLSCSRNTPISVYKILHPPEEVSLQFQEELAFEGGQIRQFQVYGSFLAIMLQARNIIIFDLVLKVRYACNLMEPCKDCDLLSLLAQSETHLFLGTHHEGENFICVWNIQKQKADSVKCQKISLFQKQEVSVVQMFGNDLWVIRLYENDRKLYNFNVIKI